MQLFLPSERTWCDYTLQGFQIFVDGMYMAALSNPQQIFSVSAGDAMDIDGPIVMCGRFDQANARFFDGKIAQFSLYDSALTNSTVSPPFSVGFIYWAFKPLTLAAITDMIMTEWMIANGWSRVEKDGRGYMFNDFTRAKVFKKEAATDGSSLTFCWFRIIHKSLKCCLCWSKSWFVPVTCFCSHLRKAFTCKQSL